MSTSKKKTKRPTAWSLRLCPEGITAPPKASWRIDWKDHATRVRKAYADGLLENPTRVKAIAAGAGARIPLSEGALEVFYAAFVWATSQGVDPFRWVLWHARKTKSAEDATARVAHLFDAGSLAAYRADPWASQNAAHDADQALMARLGSAGFVAGRDMHQGAETAKWNFRQRGREILCIEAHDLTFGFHPQSASCSSCPLKDPCSAATIVRMKERA